MELRQLKYFVVLARTLSFSEAARQLYITQGTLSQQIQQLEFELGHMLFDRTSRKVRLTTAGEELLPLAAKTIEDSVRCEQKMRDIRKEMCGTLRIGTAFCFDEYIVATIKDFQRRYPKVRLSLVKRKASDLIPMLRNDELDVALAFKPTAECEDLCIEELFVSKPMAIMRRDHPLADRKTICFSDLPDYGLIIPGTSLNARHSFDSFLKVDTTELDIRMEIDDADLMLDVIRATGLLGVVAPVGLDGLCIEDEHSGVGSETPGNPGEMIARPIEGLDSPMPCCVHTLRRAIPKASRDSFIEVLRENIRYRR